MEGGFNEPYSEGVCELKISKSRFLAQVKVCRAEAEVRSQLKVICDKHKQASHNCWAYRLGADSVTEYYSDDGEPAGTAGKPILGSISRQNLTNTLVVVTRYFGGIKLGVRGLIEAYGSTATEAIRMSGIVQRIVKFTYKIVTSYERIKSLNRLISQLGATEEDVCWYYGEKVDIVCSLPRISTSYFESVLEEMRNTGQLFTWEKITD